MLLHAAAAWALLQVDAVRKSVAELAPIMVRLVAPPEVKPPSEALEPPRPKPAVRAAPIRPRLAEPLPLLAVEVAAVPAAREVALPAPRLTEPPAAAAPAARPAVTPPDFSAAYLHNPLPVYPLASRRLREQGRVLLRVHVTAHGTADQVMLHASSGHVRLDESAREAVRTWRFVPARQGERALAAWVIVPIRFALED